VRLNKIQQQLFQSNSSAYLAELSNTVRALSPAAWYKAGVGVTVTGSGVSTLADLSGNGRDLLQSTDASRPPYLSYTGTKYLYLPGVAGNNASTPDSAANSITGDIDIRVRVAMADWTPGANMSFVDKNFSGTESYRLIMTATNFLRLDVQVSGSLRSAAATSETGFTDGVAYWIRVTRASSSGNVNFYTASDSSTEPTSWTQLGSADVASTAGAITDSGQPLTIGATPGGGSLNLAGKVYWALIYSTIGGTTPVVDFNPDRDASDASTSFASSATGETWTVNSSGGLPAQIVGRSSILFDGSADYLKTNAFTLNQPETVYLAFKQVSWTSADMIYDGNAANSMGLQQGGVTPQIQLNTDATAFVGPAAGPAVGAYGVVASIFNGASSSFQVNLGAATTGTLNATNAGAFTLGARGNGLAPGNIQFLEAIIFSTAHDATQRALVIQYLARKYGITL